MGGPGPAVLVSTSFALRWPAVVLASVLASFLLLPATTSAQLCQRGSSSVVASIHVERLGVDPRSSVGFSFEPFDHVLLGGGLRWGGVDTGEEIPRSVFAVVGGRFQALGVDLCPWVEGSQTRYDFRDRFESDRGAVAESTVAVGAELSRVVATMGRLGVGVRLEGAMRVDDRTMARRWLDLDALPIPRIDTETTSTRETTFEEALGLFIQSPTFVIAAGATRYEYFGDHMAGFVEVSFHLGGN